MKRTGKKRSTMILVIGGASSGKSRRALDLAGPARPRAFVATGQALDPEMEERITRHQASRSRDWQTAEVPVDLAPWFSKHGTEFHSVVLDCLTLWLSNLHRSRVPDAVVPDKAAELMQTRQPAEARKVPRAVHVRQRFQYCHAGDGGEDRQQQARGRSCPCRVGRTPAQ